MGKQLSSFNTFNLLELIFAHSSGFSKVSDNTLGLCLLKNMNYIYCNEYQNSYFSSFVTESTLLCSIEATND